MDDPSTAITIASLLYWLTGLAYAIGTLPVTGYLIRNRSLPVFQGIRFYENSFFDRRGINWVIFASLVYIALGLLFVLVGYWLWKSWTIGVITAITLFPIVMLISIASLAPFPLVVEPIKIVLILLGWSSLKL